MAVKDKFVLEISAQLKKDGNQLVNDLKTTIGEIEKNTKLDLGVDEEKVNKYLEKLKASLSEINSAMNNAGLEANSTAFRNFVNVLKEGSDYSEKIGKNLKLASNVVKNLDKLKDLNANNSKSINSSNSNDKISKQLKQDNLNNLKKQLKLKTEIQKLYSSMANDMDKKTNGSEVIQSRQNQISSLYKELKEVKKEQESIIKNFKQIDSVNKLDTIDDLKSTKEYDNFKRYENKANVDLAKRNSKLDERYSKYSGFEKDKKLYTKNKNSSYNKYTDEYKKTLGEYQAKINEFKSTNNKVTNFNIDELIEYENKLKELLKLLNNKDFKDPTVELLDDGTSFKEARSEIQKLIDDEGKLIKKSLETKYISPNITEVTACYREQDGQIRKVASSYNELTGAITKTNKANQDVAMTSKFDTFGDKLKKRFGDLSTYLASFASFYEVVDIIKQGFNVIKDLDTQLTEMEKVSNESLSNLQAYAKNSFDIASQIGSTGAELQASTADYMRLGKSLQDASELAKTTNILMNVSEFESIDKATESMISMTQAYQDLDSMDIVDKLNLTGNNYSISTDELAQSLQKSASALKTAKNDFDEAIALTVAGNSVVQDPDSVAAGIRTIALRMTGTDTAKKELEDMGEEADNVLTKSKLNDTLEMLTNIDSRGGISLLDDNGNYRSTAQVLMDLAERWQDIGEQDVKDGQNRQNALLEALAGKNRANILASILNDPNLLKDVYNDVSTNYQGSAMKENEKQMESIEGHLKQLQNTWEEFWYSDNNREFITDVLDLANGFLELANAIGGAKSVLILFFGAFARFKWKDELSGIFSNIKNIGSEITSTGNSDTLNKMIGNKLGKNKDNISKDVVEKTIENATSDLISDNIVDLDKYKKAKESGKNISKNIAEGIEEGKDVVENATKKVSENVVEGTAKNGMEEAVENAVGDTVGEGVEKGLENAKNDVSKKGLIKNLFKFLTENPIGAAMAATAVIMIAKTVADVYRKGLEKASENVETTLNSRKTNIDNLNQFKENIPDLAKEYDSLKDGVSSTGENLSLTNDEFQRYHEITSQIASNCPDLISGYDSTGNAILNLTNSLDDLNTAYDEMLKKEAIATFKDMGFDDVDKSMKNQEYYKTDDRYNELLKDSKTKFFGYKNAERSRKIMSGYNKFVNDNFSYNKELLKNSNKATIGLASGKNQASVMSRDALKDLSKSLAFNQEEYNATIQYFQESAFAATDEETKKVYDSYVKYLQNTVSGFQNEIAQMKDTMTAKIQTNDKYYKLDNNQRSTFDSLIQNLNEKDYNKYKGYKVEDLFNKYYEYIKSKNGSANISTLSNWQSLLTGSNGTIAENESKIQNAKNSLMNGLGLSEKTVNDKFKIDTTILDKEKEKLVKFYSDVNLEAEKSEDKTNGNVVKKYKQTAKQKEKIIKEINENLSGKELTNIANNIDSIDIDKALDEYESKYKKLYKNRDEFISDYLDSFKNVEISYKGQNKSFDQLETNVSDYSSALAQLNTFGNDNVVINSELAQTLTSMGDGFKEYIQWSEDGSTATITNTQAVKGLIKAEQEKASIDARNSKNQAIQNYKNTTNTLVELTNQLEKTVDSEGNLDQSILSTIESTESQLDVLKRNIQYYEQLETKILGATNAFDTYNLAVQQDESQNAYSTATSMVDTLKNGFETGRLGTEAFKASIQGLLSDSSYREIMDIDNLDTRYNKMKEKYNELKQYFKTDSNGNPSISGIKNFVDDSYSKGLLTSNNLNDFQIKEGKTIDDFVEKLGYSKETIYSMAEVIKSFDFNWGQSFFDGLTETDAFGKSSKDIEDYTDKIRENTTAYKDLLIQRSKLDKSKNKEKWNELTNQINKYSSAIVNNQKLQNKAYNDNAKNVMSYIKKTKEISEQQSEVDILNKKLKEYKKAYKSGKKLNDKQVTLEDVQQLELDTKSAEEELGILLKKKSELGEPTEVNLTLAKEKFEKDLANLKKKKVKIETEIKTDVSKNLINKKNYFTGGAVKLDIDKKNLLEKTTNKIKEVQSNIEQIDLQLGIKTDDGYDKATKKIKADIKEIGKGATVKVKADNKSFKATNKQLDKVKQKQDKIKKTLNVTTRHTVIEQTIKQNGGAKAAKSAIIKHSLDDEAFKPTWASFAFGQNNSKSVFNYFGKAYANGKLGNISSHTSGNTLVGELGAETIVDPWNGTYKVVGINGAEFVNVPRDAIVFNHQQTRELQKTGKIKSRGAIVSNASGYMQGFAKASPNSGNAYGGGSNIRYGGKTNTGKSSKHKSSKSKSSKSKKTKKSKETKEIKNLLDDLFDWIEIKLQRISDKTQKYMTLAENAISKTVKEAEYKYAISSTKSEINNNRAGYKKYMSYANSLIKKAKKNGVKKASAYAKKVRDGSINLQNISNEKILDFVNSYKEMYDKAKECDSAILSLSSQLSDLAESFYNIPTEYAEKKIEKFSDKMDVLSAKLDITKTYKNQNKILDKQTSIQKKIMKAYDSASKTTNSNFKKAKGKINSTKDSAFKGLNTKQKKAIVAKVKSGEEVHISPKYSATLQSAIANYNKALEANRVAYNNAQKASDEYTKALRDNTKAKYDNITAYYDGKKAIDDSHVSKNDAILEYRTAMGYSNTSDDQKSVIENKIKYEKERLGFTKQELKTYDPAKMKKDYDAEKLSKNDYYSMLQHRQELEEEYYSTQTNLKNLNDEIKNLKITHLDYIIDGIGRALEKFQNLISMKEAKGEKITEDLYLEQMKKNEDKIPILYDKYKEYEDEQRYYAVESEKYQELEQKKSEILNEVANAVTENEQLRDTIHELRFKKANEANDALETTIDDMEHLKDLLSDDKLIDDNGKFTESGLANIALLGLQIDDSKKKIANYRYMLEKLTESYKNGNISLEEYNEQSKQYIEAIQSSVVAVEDYKDALIDLYKQQLEAENKALQDNISKRKEALQAKKSYYDYDKTIKNANKDINTLKNQIAALEGVKNASAKAEVERLKSQLSDAEENLKDTKYEHMVELKLTGYDEMSKSADEVLQDLLEDISTNAKMQEQVISSMLDNVVKNYDEAYGKIKETINQTAINGETSNSLADSIYTLSDALLKGFDHAERTTGDIDSSTIYKGNPSTSDKINEMYDSSSDGNSSRMVASITPSNKSVSIKVGETKTITFDIKPSDANKSVSATSSDTKVATVTSGKTVNIKGVKAGTCSITVVPVAGGKTATIGVTVTAVSKLNNTSGDKSKVDVVKNKPSGGDKSSSGKKSSDGGSNDRNKNKPVTSSHVGLVSNLSGNITSSSSSANIKKVQTALKGLGIKGKDGKALTIDGKWGKNTDYAVKYFQKLNKWTGSLTADGVIGTKTKAKFRKAGYYYGGIVDNVMSLNNQEFLNMLKMNKDDGLITAKLGEGVIPKNIMPNFTQQLEKFNSLPADKILNNINNTSPNLEINIDKFMDVHGNVDKNCVNDLRQLQNDITNNITSTLTKEFRKLGYK